MEPPPPRVVLLTTLTAPTPPRFERTALSTPSASFTPPSWMVTCTHQSPSLKPARYAELPGGGHTPMAPGAEASWLRASSMNVAHCPCANCRYTALAATG